MNITKIYKKKRAALLKSNKFLIANKVADNRLINQTTYIIPKPLFSGGSFIKILILENDKNLMEILTNNEINIVCMFYNNKWYIGNYIKQRNLIKQNITILSLICKLKNKMI